MFGESIHVSPHCVAKPKRPKTPEMLAVVENLERHGQIKLVPTAFRVQGRLIVHPVIYEELKRQSGVRIEPFSYSNHPGWRIR